MENKKDSPRDDLFDAATNLLFLTGSNEWMSAGIQKVKNGEMYTCILHLTKDSLLIKIPNFFLNLFLLKLQLIGFHICIFFLTKGTFMIAVTCTLV